MAALIADNQLVCLIRKCSAGVVDQKHMAGVTERGERRAKLVQKLLQCYWNYKYELLSVYIGKKNKKNQKKTKKLKEIKWNIIVFY